MYEECKTIRSGNQCCFWKKSKKDPEGHCSFDGGQCSTITEKCEGCEHIDGGFCLAYKNPSARWIGQKCPMYLNPEEIKQKAEEEKKLNPLKASKRGAKRK